MEEEQKKERKLFSYLTPNNPMKFAIILKDLKQIEVLRVLKHIDEQGGEFMGFDPVDSEYINLASPKYEGPPDQIVIDIKYVKRCVNEKRLLNLDAFQIGGPKSPCDEGCMPLYDLLEMIPCTHRQTTEEVLKIMMS